jgi:hypothetical protein
LTTGQVSEINVNDFALDVAVVRGVAKKALSSLNGNQVKGKSAKPRFLVDR